MIRSNVAHVDLAALAANLRAIRAFVSEGGVAGGPEGPPLRTPTDGDRRAGASAPAEDPALAERGGTTPRIVAVVKANAYGHGAERVALALEHAGADLLACADIEEGIVLRRAGVRVPILVFGALSVSDLDGLFEFALTPTISTPGAARAVQAAAAARGRQLAYHLKIDTGMNRLGFRHDNLRRSLPELLAGPNLKMEGVYTHFASADMPDSPVFNEQRLRFEAEMAEKQRIYGETYPLDEDLLAALAIMPDACGIALGFDRLVMLATGAPRIEDVIWAPPA